MKKNCNTESQQNGNGSSSHYRINRGENPIHISEIIKRCLEELRMKRYVNQCPEERNAV